MSKLRIVLFAFCALSLASCGGEKLSEADIEKKVEELAKAKIDEAIAKSNADCEARMSTEVKLKADSIIANTK